MPVAAFCAPHCAPSPLSPRSRVPSRWWAGCDRPPVPGQEPVSKKALYRLSPCWLLPSSGPQGRCSALPASSWRGCVSPPFSWWTSGPASPWRPWVAPRHVAHRWQSRTPLGSYTLHKLAVVVAVPLGLFTFSATLWPLLRPPDIAPQRLPQQKAGGALLSTSFQVKKKLSDTLRWRVFYVQRHNCNQHWKLGAEAEDELGVR